MNQQKARIGIVGIGNMGVQHLRHVIDLPNTQLAAVCDRKAARFEAAFTAADPPKTASSNVDYAARLAETAQFTDYQEMLDGAELDGVIIATPHYDHPDMSLQAFARGIHVLVEKPIAVHVKEARRMIDGYRAAKEAQPDLVFAAMFMQRAWGHWRVIKSMIAGGELGAAHPLQLAHH